MRMIAVWVAVGWALSISAAAEEKPRTVPVDDMYGTTGQKEIKKPAGAELTEILKSDKKAHTLFLVNGKDIEAAVKASAAGFAKEPTAVTSKDEAWLAVYLGSNGSSPPAFQLKDVEIKDKTIRLNYQKGFAVSADIHQYYAWAPLGKLAAGEYTVELYELGGKEVVKKAKVKVGEK